MLLDIGDVDEAIRQINTVLTLQPNHAVALTMLAQAYRFKELYPQSIEAARKAIQIAPKSAEPHLWLGDSLRLSGKYRRRRRGIRPVSEAQRFRQQAGRPVELLRARLAVRHGAQKRRASQQDIWKDLRSLAYFGICDCERKLNKYDSAIAYCQKSLTYYDKDPYAHFALGLAYLHKAMAANETGRSRSCVAASQGGRGAQSGYGRGQDRAAEYRE